MDFKRIFDTLEYQKQKYPNQNCLVHKQNGAWKAFSCKEVIDWTDQIAKTIKSLGFHKGDKACILSKIGSAYWIITDIALQKAGIVVVPLHSNSTREEIEFIIESTEAKACFVANAQLMDHIPQATLSKLSIFLFEPEKGYETIEDLYDKGKNILGTIINDVDEKDLATIIFTSGSTGNPKGVMLSHYNIVSNAKSIISVNPISSKYVCASYLPLSHVFERMTIYSYLASGVSIYFISEVSNILDDLREIRPHLITSVPRILERTFDYVQKQLEERKYLNKYIGNWALKKGRIIDLSQKFNIFDWLKIKFAQLLVYRKWRKTLGGRLKRIVVGAAAMDPDLARLYAATGIRIREGYGLTETSPAVSINRFEPGGNRFGTVGMVLPGVEVKIHLPDDEGEGEICVKGPNVMMGYFKKEELTKKAFDDDGWFHTGDVGKFVEGRFLKITDRKKNIFKTSSGRYVTPQLLEIKIKKNAYINHCLIIGFQRPYVACLIVPHFTRLKKWCSENDIHWTSEQFMVLHPMVNKFYQEFFDKLNEGLKSHERIKRFVLLYHDWSIESGEFSNTLKPKRHAIMKMYHKEIGKMYSEKRR